MRLWDKGQAGKTNHNCEEENSQHFSHIHGSSLCLKKQKRTISCHKLSLQASMLYPCAIVPTKVEQNLYLYWIAIIAVAKHSA
jgi:hypothetical protein